MDLKKAQRLLTKIQAFLDDGHAQDLSRLEKDLIKSYVQQLYEAVTSDDSSSAQDHSKPLESLQRTQKDEPLKKQESSAPWMQDTSKTDPVKPVHTDYTPPLQKTEAVYPEYKPIVIQEKPVVSEKITYHENPIYDEKPSYQEKPTYPEKIDYQEKSAYYEKQIVEEKPTQLDPVNVEVESTPPYYQPSKPVEEVKENQPSNFTQTESNDPLQKLFDVQKSDDMASRFGHVPIASIESAMGLNERIFTLNELFGGDKALFDAWCTKLNSLASFSDAKNVLINGPAKDFKWANPERIKMAEQFIRIVSRRYPKS